MISPEIYTTNMHRIYIVYNLHNISLYIFYNLHIIILHILYYYVLHYSRKHYCIMCSCECRTYYIEIWRITYVNFRHGLWCMVKRHGVLRMVIHVWSLMYMVIHIWSLMYMVIHIWSLMCMLIELFGFPFFDLPRLPLHIISSIKSLSLSDMNVRINR